MTPAQAAVVLNENVVMHTPVLIKPIVGRTLVSIAISISTQSRDDPGKYIFEGKIDARTTFLRWLGTVQGHNIESLELLIDDESDCCSSAQSYTGRIGSQDIQISADRSERRQAA
jgi:hypothetical protein